MEFVLAWDAEGRELLGFRPDFYLPALNVFVELTTLRQRLVTRKNRKIRMLRNLYPEIRVEILYRRDYDAMLAGEEIPLLTDLLGRSVPKSA